jgi:hypothetical protein
MARRWYKLWSKPGRSHSSSDSETRPQTSAQMARISSLCAQHRTGTSSSSGHHRCRCSCCVRGCCVSQSCWAVALAHLRGVPGRLRPLFLLHLLVVTHRADDGCAWVGRRRRWSVRAGAAHTLRVRVEIMGAQKCRIAGKSQSVLMMTNPIISTRTRTPATHKRQAGALPNSTVACGPRKMPGLGSILRCTAAKWQPIVPSGSTCHHHSHLMDRCA